jgi:DNA-binding response OmpR family regulator
MMTQPFPNLPSPARRILVVEDAVEVRQLLKLSLQREGFTVLAAGSGEEAVALVQQQGLPHLAIVDIVLPGMDGFALAAELQGRADVPILFLSALSDTATKVEGLERFAEDYVTKPFTFAELAVRIRRILLRSGRTDVLAADVVIDPRLSVNFAQHYAVLDGRRVKLTGIESKFALPVL